MTLSQPVRSILEHYGSETPGIKAQLVRLLNHGALKGTGRLVVMAVDQGFEHGPMRSFGENPWGMDPLNHARLAAEQGLSALAAPLGFLERVADVYAGQLPFILKLNHACSLTSGTTPPHLAQVASVDQAIHLGCIGIGWTLYPGSDAFLTQLEGLRSVAEEAKRKGVLVVVWSYPRGAMSKTEERGLDTIAYGAHMACLAGAHIVKVKFPDASLMPSQEKYYPKGGAEVWQDPLKRARHIVESCFGGQRLVLFSGGEKKNLQEMLLEANAIHQAGGAGSILGRNCFQRTYEDAQDLLEKLVRCYQAS